MEGDFRYTNCFVASDPPHPPTRRYGIDRRLSNPLVPGRWNAFIRRAVWGKLGVGGKDVPRVPATE